MSEFAKVCALSKSLSENIEKVIIGHHTQIEWVIATLFAGGHILLEDKPGTGKTTLAKALAKSIEGKFSRIQFTPDLLPADITGMRVFEPQTGSFHFVKGPAFSNVFLADEINRATPRTQSALLECMEEIQITDGGITYPLDAPFFVIATQNPIEIQGTFPLPEAQLDRFLMSFSLGYPTHEETVSMLKRFSRNEPLTRLSSVTTVDDINNAISICRRCEVHVDLMDYICKLCENARDPEKVKLGPSPRAALAMMRAVQALAVIRGRDYVIPDDVKELAVPVLAHRIIPRTYREKINGASIVMDVIKCLPVPTEVRS